MSARYNSPCKHCLTSFSADNYGKCLNCGKQYESLGNSTGADILLAFILLMLGFVIVFFVL